MIFHLSPETRSKSAQERLSKSSPIPKHPNLVHRCAISPVTITSNESVREKRGVTTDKKKEDRKKRIERNDRVQYSTGKPQNEVGACPCELQRQKNVPTCVHTRGPRPPTCGDASDCKLLHQGPAIKPPPKLTSKLTICSYCLLPWLAPA